MKITILLVIAYIVMQSVCFAYTASWYSQNDVGVVRLTASGEVFDDHDLTAACWLYPIGTYVVITNLRNNKKVTVRINDRGPARRLLRKGRLIDLSRSAFIKIADLKDGVINIKMERV